jgi:hypothetical protein
MFISNAEKQSIRKTIEGLESRILELEIHAERARNHIQAVTNMHLASKQFIAPPFAPYGLKKDGTPCKKPGRKAKIKEVKL